MAEGSRQTASSRGVARGNEQAERSRPHRLPRTLPGQSRGAVARNAGDPQPPGSSSHGIAEEMPGQRQEGRWVAPATAMSRRWDLPAVWTPAEEEQALMTRAVQEG